MNKKIMLTLAVSLLIVGLGMNSVNAVVSNVTNSANCFQEEGENYCWDLSPNFKVPIRFTGSINCISETDESCGDDCSDVVIGCTSKVEVTEDTEIEFVLKKYPESGDAQRIEEKTTLSPGEEIETVIMLNQVDFSKCSEPKLNSSGGILLPLVYLRECEYSGEEFVANVTYHQEGFVIHQMSKASGAGILSSPDLPTVILILLIIGVGTWVFYPKITKTIENKNK